VFDGLTALESNVRWQEDNWEVSYPLFLRSEFTNGLRAIVADQSGSYLYELNELTDLFEPPVTVNPCTPVRSR